eukprot:CAMPEP_0206482538 /NCGR_PEP_ID=MMETSP0324_2-20121206/38929_1 /ASSEMBLY_ACC=CAM_ASM_000836 /TAXON_ID=2866 /ORGANISM="Crypthecodinium cohnii, Strain Seligo" /LENGTH=641 /DNA_ID=CAMNT_0053960495 /DNA_START=106 /DNA_END=2031 /DNA_ORIENTATION=-
MATPDVTLEAKCTATTASPVSEKGSESTGVTNVVTDAMAEADAKQPTVATASLTFKDLAFEAVMNDKSKKTILAPCSGHLEAGQLVAIMGPSGSGKSTLLDMLAMKKTAPYTGEVLMNGHPRDPVLFRRVAAYVGQDDHMPAHWTVREALNFNVTLKQRVVGSLWEKREATRARTQHLMDVFGLAEVANVYVGGSQVRGISGGQRRRVSLARGLAAEASILFADEPTSGLSATDAEVCVRALRTIAKEQNVLMLVNIHQPRREVSALFDTLILLTPNPGRLVYFGSMADAPTYFEACGLPVPQGANATDYYLDLVTPGSDLDAAEALVTAYETRTAPDVARLVDEMVERKGQSCSQMIQLSSDRPRCLGWQSRPKAYAVPFHVQLRMLISRKVRITFRNPESVGISIVMPAVMGVVLGLLFQGIGRTDFGVPTVMFVFIQLVMLSLQSLPLMPGLIEERVYMKEETSEKLYQESAQILGNLIVNMPLSVFSALVQSSIIFAFTGFSASLYLVIVGWTLLIFTAFDAIFQCMAAIAANGDEALMFATPFLVLFMLFNGVVITWETAPVYLRWVFPISPTYWTLQAIVTRIADEEGSQDSFLLEHFGFEAGHEFHAVAIIVVMNVVLRSLQVLALKFLNNLQK